MCLPTPLFKKNMWPLQLHIFQKHFRPVEGFDYLYLTEADFTSFPSGAVIGKFVPGVGYALDAVVGQGLSLLGLQQGWWKEWILNTNNHLGFPGFPWRFFMKDVYWHYNGINMCVDFLWKRKTTEIYGSDPIKEPVQLSWLSVLQMVTKNPGVECQSLDCLV